MAALLTPHYTVDIEATNRCNAKCSFCPRDLTPHQGLMTEEVFDQALARAVEFRDTAKEMFNESVNVTFCGLGEALVNPRTPDFVGKVRGEGLHCALSTNAGLLNERKATALLDAGLQRIDINIGEKDEAYEQVYGLPFEKVERNVLRFAEMADGRCVVAVVLVNYNGDMQRVEEMRAYWRARGIKSFIDFEIINRGGSYDVDHMQYDAHAERERALELLAQSGSDPVCGTPFVFMFVGWDGQYYLCSSDWQKEVPLGSVFDVSFAEIMTSKLERVQMRDKVCSTCTRDPVNRVIDQMREVATGAAAPASVNALVERLATTSDAIRSRMHTLGYAVEPRSREEILAGGVELAARPGIARAATA